MCVVSMVHDFYGDRFRKYGSGQDGTEWSEFVERYIPNQPSVKDELAEIRKLIAEFREALAAALRVDELTAQPDCVDPEKATLEGRVAELEKRLDSLGRGQSGVPGGHQPGSARAGHLRRRAGGRRAHPSRARHHGAPLHARARGGRRHRGPGGVA